MSDSQTQSYSPTPSIAKRRRTRPVVVWLLVLLIAAGAFAVAFWYAGGTGAIEQLGGLVSSFMGSPSGGSGGQKPAVSPTATSTASALPPEAEVRMLAEQAEARVPLTELVDGQITSLTLGNPKREESSATVPLTAVFKDGRSVTGTMMFKKYREAWYFVTLTRNGETHDVDVAAPGGFDSGIVSTITQQQAQPGTQELLTNGLLEGGYKMVTVDAVTQGPRTATVEVTLSGGTESASKGRIVFVSKVDGATTYWFVARFEKL
jgi:hypothetical protein